MTESFDWLKLGYALFLIMMLVMIWPNAKRMWKESPKAKQGEWMTFAMLIGGVVVFIFFLVSMVRN